MTAEVNDQFVVSLKVRVHLILVILGEKPVVVHTAQIVFSHKAAVNPCSE